MINDLKKYINFKNPLFQFSLFISFFGIIALSDLLIPTVNPVERNNYIITFVFTFLTGIVMYFITRYGFGKIASNPLNFLVSTWIVFLLIHPTNPLLYFPVAVAAISLGKFLFRKNSIPVINPAALAITLTTIVSMGVTLVNPDADTLLVSWWGADMFQNITNTIPVLNILVPVGFLLGFLYFANSFKKLPHLISFSATFLILTFVYNSLNMPLDRATNFISLMLFNATAFCATVMLPEPKTSPVFLNHQILIGIIAGISLFVFNTFLGSWPVDPLINTILIANIATLIAKSIPRKSAVPTPSVPAPAATPLSAEIQ